MISELRNPQAFAQLGVLFGSIDCGLRNHFGLEFGSGQFE
jgi:hypothetical protein